MPWDLANLANTACQAVFGAGEVVSYTPAGQSAQALTPIAFDEAAEVFLPGDDGAPVFAGTSPVLDVHLADFDALWGAGVRPHEEDRLVVNGVSYEVTLVEQGTVNTSAKLHLTRRT